MIIVKNGMNNKKQKNSIHFVVQVDDVNSSNTDNLVIKNTNITNIERYRQLVDFLDSPNILRF